MGKDRLTPKKWFSKVEIRKAYVENVEDQFIIEDIR